jgi:hypothetical protein
MYHIMNLEKKGEILCKVSLDLSNFLNALNRTPYVNDKYKFSCCFKHKSLKGPKHEIFGSGVFKQISPMS